VTWHLDTNVCIDLIRGRSRGGRLPPFEHCKLSAVVVSELWTGVSKSPDPAVTKLKLQTYLGLFTIVPFDANAAETYGEIRAQLEKAGTPIGAMDLLIAAHAKSAGATLLTSNLKEFRRVPGLSSQAWGS
jgi:tRNA(fMet)-specific endonuclease VapC